VFKLAGKVVSVDLSLDKDNQSRGFGVVEFEHPVEAVQAISMFDRQTLYDRRMTVRLDRIPDKSEGVKLPEGLKGIGIGLGPNGEALRDVARNLPNIQNNPAQNNIPSLNAANINPLNTLTSSLTQLQNIASAPAPVAPPNSSLLGVPSNSNLSNLAALSNVVGGLTSLSNANINPLLSSAAALGLNLNTSAANDVGSNQMSQSFNSYNTSGFSSGRNDDSFNSVRNYNTSNDDYGSRNFGNSSGISRKQPSDTVLIRNVRKNKFN
jgi:RNA recognition motif-containing protein